MDIILTWTRDQEPEVRRSSSKDGVPGEQILCSANADNYLTSVNSVCSSDNLMYGQLFVQMTPVIQMIYTQSVLPLVPG
jgi:hypothetical protein